MTAIVEDIHDVSFEELPSNFMSPRASVNLIGRSKGKQCVGGCMHH